MTVCYNEKCLKQVQRLEEITTPRRTGEGILEGDEQVGTRNMLWSYVVVTASSSSAAAVLVKEN